MPADYSYPFDGRLHTRYSQLVRCTPGQIDRVVGEHYGVLQPFSSGHMGLGTERHEMFAEEMTETGRLPKCFQEVAPEYADIEIDFIEHEMKAEILEGIVLHSQPDAGSKQGYVFDFKMTARPATKWRSSKQMIVYAYQFGLRGIRIHTMAFLIERWNPDKDTILGYEVCSIPVTEDDLQGVKEWIRERARILEAAINIHKEIA